jgi:nucleoid-associated protein YgaU
MRRLATCLLCLACAACATRSPNEGGAAPELPPGADRGAAPAPASDSVPFVFTAASEPSASLRLSNASELVGQAGKIMPGWHDADPELSQAHDAFGRRDWPGTSQHADEAQAIADAALSDHYMRLAEGELVEARGYTGLDDAELVLMRQAEETLVAGNGRLAYGRLRMLNARLASGTKSYTVKRGDSLWVIAGRPEVYANPWLWPIIWQANTAVIRNPKRLLAGQQLELPKHPTVNDVQQAIAVARGKPGAILQVGEVRPVDEPPSE